MSGNNSTPSGDANNPASNNAASNQRPGQSKPNSEGGRPQDEKPEGASTPSPGSKNGPPGAPAKPPFPPGGLSGPNQRPPFGKKASTSPTGSKGSPSSSQNSTSNPPTSPGTSGKKSKPFSKKSGSTQRSARSAVDGNDKADKASRQRDAAARAGGTIAQAAGGNADDKRLAEGMGRDLADMKNGEGSRAKAAYNAAEKGVRLAANKKTGGASEKILKTAAGKLALKIAKIVAVANVLLPVVLVFFLIMGAVLAVASLTGVIEGASGSDSAEYSLEDDHPLALPDEYLEAYREAAEEHEIPWTLLAGLAQVATEQGRFAPSDVIDYGSLVDRAPNRAPIGSSGAGSSGGKYAPPPGTAIAVLGDSFVASGPIPSSLSSELSNYKVSSKGENGATIDDVAPDVRAALVVKTPVVVVQVGVNDINQNAAPETYRKQMKELMDAASSSTCFVWVNVQRFYGGDYGYLQPRAKKFNETLLEEAASRPWVSIADVATPLAVSGMQGSDGLHLSAQGSRVWASAVSATIRSCVRSKDLTPSQAPDATDTTTPKALTVSGQSVKVDASYGTYVCKGGVCGPYPRLGVHKGAPLGPFQLTPEFVSKDRSRRSPDDIDEASDMIAEELARLKEEVLDESQYGQYDSWEDDPAVARSLWSRVVAKAPVVLPQQSSSASQCAPGPLAGPQGSPYSWPLSSPVSVGEYGSALSGSERVQVSGMLLEPADVEGTQSVPVLASSAGSVAETGSDPSGWFVVISHEGNFSTKYSRLKGLSVSQGSEVAAGSKIGVSGAKILFETRVAGSPRNPRLYVANSADLPLAVAVSSEDSGTDGDAAVVGTPVDPCTGLRITSTASTSFRSVPATTSATAATINLPGQLVMPAAGVKPNMLVDTFADCRDVGCPRLHRGIDIMLHIGTPLIAVTDARVVYAGIGGVPCPSTGKQGLGVTLEDSQRPFPNRYYYGHMDSISVSTGQQVAAGSIIGRSGQTGNACASGPHLHFSINESNERVVNPYPVLSGARALEISDFAGALGAGEASRLSGLNSFNGAPEFVVAYASFFGGIIKNDPDAGTLPGSASGFQSDTVSGVSGADLAARKPEIAAIIRLYFPQEQWDNAIRVADCESSLDASVVSKPNWNGTKDWGLFQFNDGGTLQGWLTRTGEDPKKVEKALDPHWSARAAALKVKTDGNWGAWSCAHTPYGERTYGLSIVSLAPKEIASNGKDIDYTWQQPGAGDTSRRALSLDAPRQLSGANPADGPRPSLYQGTYASSMVQVKSSTDTCTGTVIEGSKAVLTAAHCVATKGGLKSGFTVLQGTKSYKPSAVSVRIDWDTSKEWCAELGLSECTSTNADMAILWFDKPLPIKGLPLSRCVDDCSTSIPTDGSVLVGFQMADSLGNVLNALPGIDRKVQLALEALSDKNSTPGAKPPYSFKLTSCAIGVQYHKLFSNGSIGVRCGMIQGASGGVMVSGGSAPQIVGVTSGVYGDKLWNLVAPAKALRQAFWGEGSIMKRYKL